MSREGRARPLAEVPTRCRIRNSENAMLATVSRRSRVSRAFSSTSEAGWRHLERRGVEICALLDASGQTVSVAEWTSGGLIAASLWTSPIAHIVFRGAGVRLAYGINRDADRAGVERSRDFAKDKSGLGDAFEHSKVGQRESARWGLVYEEGEAHSEPGTPVHALELAHAAKLNLDTAWGVGESCVPGPKPHRGCDAGSGFVAVAGPTRETTGVLKLGASDASRGANMVRFASAALDLMSHLQSKQVRRCEQCGQLLAPAALHCGACGAVLMRKGKTSAE